MSGFPDHFRDLTAFSGDGLEYSTTSDTAVKMFDAVVNMVTINIFDYDELRNNNLVRLSTTTATINWMAGEELSKKCSLQIQTLPWAKS